MYSTNQHVMPDYSSIKYFFRGEGGKIEEGSFVIRSIKYNPSYGEWFLKQRAAAWDRTHDSDNIYRKPKDSSASGRMPDYRALYEIKTTKGENVTVDGRAEAATMWQMGEAPKLSRADNKLQVRLDGEEIFPDRVGAVELARQINKFDYEQIQAGAKSHSLFRKSSTPYGFEGIKPEQIKQA